MATNARPELATLLGDLAIDMQDQQGTAATLRAIVHGAVDLVPGARWAGISMIQGRRVTAEVPTDPIVSDLDQLQTSLGEGPCLTALTKHKTVRIDDMTTDTRWPRFAHAAASRGVRSLISFQLFVRGENLGALNLYGDQGSAFGDEAEHIGEILAQHASIAFVGAAAEAQFDSALASRDIIGQAKGFLMHQKRLTSLQAFQLLISASQSSNMKLVDVARWIIEQHELDLTTS